MDLLVDLWFETGSSSVAIRENATQTFPEMMKVQLQYQHLFCVCPVPVEMAVSVEDNQWRDRWLCLSFCKLQKDIPFDL